MSLSKYQRQEIINYILTNNITNRDEFRQCWKTNKIEGVTQESAEAVLSEFKYICKTIGDKELQSSNTDLLRKGLKFKDKLNYERKTFYKDLRSINALEELNKELIEKIKLLKPREVQHSLVEDVEIKNDDVLVVQLSDIHVSEVVREQYDNFNFEVLCKRLKKFANHIKQQCRLHGYNKILVALTGDLINNNTIISKLLNNSCNKAKAILLAVDILEQFLLDLKSVCNDISIACVAGNESRLYNEHSEDSEIITNNCDFIVFNMLEKLLGNTFKFIKGFYNELVVNVNGSNILLTHGTAYAKGDVEKAVTETIGRYSAKGLEIRYIIFGHIHNSRISTMFGRSGSIVGDNAYSGKTLNLLSRASQNLYIVSKDGSINCTCIDLQEYTEDSYDIVDKLNYFGDNTQPVLPEEFYKIHKV